MTVAPQAQGHVRALASDATRWGQLAIGICCMVMIANLQYGWTLFVTPIDQKYHWGRAAIQVAFTIFVVTETWLVPPEGYLIDRFIPKVMVVIVALLMRAPETGEVPVPATPAVQQTRRDYGPAEVLKTVPFWVMYVMFVMVGTGGLMATAQLAPIAKDFKVDGVPVAILGLTLPALQFALSIDRVLNGLTRPFFGWVSDHIGRENTMFVAFLIEGIGIYALMQFAADPLAFVILSGLAFFAWAEADS